MDQDRALEISRMVARSVKKAVDSLPLSERGRKVGIGKDGTPTKAVDSVAERAAMEVLLKERVTVVSEESGVVGEGDVIVALDPIDGTFNAERGIPIYSVSLCFSDSERLGDAFFGYVYNIATGEEYYAGEDAYKDGEKISVSGEERIECNAVYYYPLRPLPLKRVRILGCASLELCFVADGRFDCFIDTRGMLRIYDVAAGIYLVQKAGGIVSDERGKRLDSKRFSMEERLNIVAANPKLHPKLLELVR